MALKNLGFFQPWVTVIELANLVVTRAVSAIAELRYLYHTMFHASDSVEQIGDFLAWKLSRVVRYLKTIPSNSVAIQQRHPLRFAAVGGEEQA